MISKPLPEALAEMQRLAERGVQEVVLCGIRLGAYGREDGRTSLAALLHELRCLPLPRLRLSSLEPMDVDEALLAELADHPTLCHHLHLPLQSGDDAMLAAMGRTYRGGGVRPPGVAGAGDLAEGSDQHGPHRGLPRRDGGAVPAHRRFPVRAGLQPRARLPLFAPRGHAGGRAPGHAGGGEDRAHGAHAGPRRRSWQKRRRARLGGAAGAGAVRGAGRGRAG